MFRPGALLLLFLVVMMVPLRAAAEGWTICNRTPEELKVAVAYFDEANKWMSEGWWALGPCGGCKFVLNANKTERTNVFFRAVTRDGSERIGGDQRFCVSTRAAGSPPFTVRSNANCGRANGYALEGFRVVTIDSDRNHTTNITGAVGNRRCID
ncbi:MAG: DUF1036 domain-containing protein [Alphaproteobacteria bacterium]